ncbi:hypothetical protein OS493_038876 [Desmophyllum pertusum]|uniref:HECT domain-containing protein n=1 Tax=Desmophyllum pertusum TaxID=174260 RepID=A0A9W9ZHV2_9CNID|nr:hypothetical protein OS493_038876 [Desmophyllum pertusum]
MADSADNDLVKVCNFLRERGVQEGVVEKFEEEKMDISAVLNANDDVLKDMGLSTAGDRLSLRGFCSTAQETQQNKEKESKRRRLLEAFMSSKKDRSMKLVTESLVLSRWSDYLQDIADAEDSDITLSDILFFTTGCKVLPQRAIPVTIEFLHEPGTEGLSRFPTANTCSNILRLPVLHGDYESFKADMTLGFLNARGFGTA